MTVKLTICGKPVEAQENWTILEAAESIGIKIPRLCYMKGLSEPMHCRICSVKVKGRPRTVPACGTKVADGMEVVAFDDELEAFRKTLIETMLTTGHHNCYSCESNGKCELQDLAYQYGIEITTMPEDEKTWDYIETSEVLALDRNKCILCGRCVRTCSEKVLSFVYDFANKGYQTYLNIGASEEFQEANCVSCGNCVQACPTGALSMKNARGVGRTWEFDKVQSLCPYCGVGCKLELWVKDNKIERVYGMDGQDNNELTCVKGRFGLDFVGHKDRLTDPLIRKNGKLEKASWDEALNLIASKFTQIKKESGPDAFAGLASAKVTNEENYLFQKFMRAVLGTNNVDHCARL